MINLQKNHSNLSKKSKLLHKNISPSFDHIINENNFSEYLEQTTNLIDKSQFLSFVSESEKFNTKNKIDLAFERRSNELINS